MNHRLWRFVFCFAACLCAPITTFAQDDGPPLPDDKPVLNLSKEFGLPGLGKLGNAEAGAEVKFTGKLEVAEGTGEGLVSLTANIPASYHIYSTTTKGGLPTRFKLIGEGAELLGKFEPDRDAPPKYSEAFMLDVEEYEGTVVWTAAVKLPSDADPEQLDLIVQASGQICDEGSCRTFNAKVPLKFGGYLAPAAAAGEIRVESAHVTWKGRLEPAAVAPGGKAQLILRVEPDPGWHVYPVAPHFDEKATGPRPTLVALSKSSGWLWSEPTLVNSPSLKSGPGGFSYYEGPVEWAITLRAPQTNEDQATLRGVIGFQSCDEKSCTAPAGLTFSVKANIGGQAKINPLVSFAPGDYAKTAETVASMQPTMSTRIHWATLWPQLGLAILGGLLLNLMPCVLPVIGLKVLSFARQAGESRARVLALNVAYVAGLMLVFLALATAAAFLNWGWGQQFTSLEFRVTMTGLVFVMALSFLGVWQLPVPGFATSEHAGKLQNQHGYGGAFFKGMFTTVLATPCSGPFLGAVFGYTLTQPAIVTYLIFAAVGLGMGLPYLMVGIFPALVKFLPKPGEWMETFENVLGFVLLATVVYLMAITGQKYFIPTFALLIGLWFACWLIGRVPEYAGTGKVISTWGVATLVVVAVAYGSFTFLSPVRELYEWKPYNQQTLAALQKEGKTVMLDFTADWCATCQWNFRTAINTSRVKNVVEQNGVVSVKADWTDFSEEIQQKLRELESNSIPLLAIFPANKPEEPILLRDAVVESQVIAALEKAGPSRAASGIEASTAMSRGAE